MNLPLERKKDYFEIFYTAILVLLSVSNREIWGNVYPERSYIPLLIGFCIPFVFRIVKKPMSIKAEVFLLVVVCIFWLFTRPEYTLDQAREQLFNQVGTGYQYSRQIKDGEKKNYYYFELEKNDCTYIYEVDPNTGSCKILE